MRFGILPLIVFIFPLNPKPYSLCKVLSKIANMDILCKQCPKCYEVLFTSVRSCTCRASFPTGRLTVIMSWSQEVLSPGFRVPMGAFDIVFLVDLPLDSQMIAPNKSKKPFR